MASLSRDQIKDYVKTALLEVADFRGDIEGYDFRQFQEYHKSVFLNKLKQLINSGPYYDRNGNSDYERYYDVPLSIGELNSWKSISDCISFIFDNLIIKKRNPNKVQLS